jgi:hypothetical protein
MPGPGSFYGFSALYQGNKADASAKIAMKLYSSGVPVLEKIQIAITQHDAAYGMPVSYFNRYVPHRPISFAVIQWSPFIYPHAMNERTQGAAVRGTGEPSRAAPDAAGRSSSR